LCSKSSADEFGPYERASRPHNSRWFEQVSTSVLRQLFLKADHRSNIRNALLPDSDIDDISCICLEAAASPDGELVNEDALNLDNRSRLLYCSGISGAGAFGL
jgi:hypothetical protein